MVDVTLRLSRIDIFQILDAVRIREESWRATASALNSGDFAAEHNLEYCSSADEASSIADHYSEIDRIIMSQL